MAVLILGIDAPAGARLAQRTHIRFACYFLSSRLLSIVLALALTLPLFRPTMTARGDFDLSGRGAYW
jgi:hypothetical protein